MTSDPADRGQPHPIEATDSLLERQPVARVLDARRAGSGATGRGVLVGVIDSGWDSRILDERVIRGIGLVDPVEGFEVELSADDHDRHGHGTACSQVLLDVAADCHVIPVRVFGSRLETSPEALVAAIDWACGQGIRLINLSLGTLRRDALRYLYVACERARRSGAIIVSAARAGQDEWSYPAVFDPVIGVGSAPFEDPYLIRYQDGAAVECAVRTSGRTWRGAGEHEFVVSGTSYGAPVVTGLLARWLEDSPAMNLDAARARLARSLA